MTLHSKPGIGYVHYHIERIRQSVGDLEREMSGWYATGNRACELEALAERLVNMTKPSKGHLEGVEAKEFRDAA